MVKDHADTLGCLVFIPLLTLPISVKRSFVITAAAKFAQSRCYFYFCFQYQEDILIGPDKIHRHFQNLYHCPINDS